MFSNQDKEEVAKKINSIESKTSAEIVICVKPESDTYFWTNYLMILMGMVFGAVVAMLAHVQGPWPLSWDYFLVLELAFAILLFSFSFNPAIRRLVIGKKRLSNEVTENAEAFFYRAGVVETENRQGILIYISLFEKQVRILFDKGISSKIDQKFWDALGAEIAMSMAHKDSLQSFLICLEELGQKLASNYPLLGEKKNSLKDEIR